MGTSTIDVGGLEMTVNAGLRTVATGIDVLGVAVIVAGIGWATLVFVGRRMAACHYEAYKIRVGRSLLLGLEILVAADIVKTVALELTLASLAVLVGLVLVRTFLSWTLMLEVEGRWPWQRATPSAVARPGTSGRTAAL